MNFTRSDQINSLFKKEIALLLPNFFSTKRYGMLTVTNVNTSKNFDTCHVGISVLRNKHQFEEDAKKHTAKLQRDLNSKLYMKKIPKIILEIDRTSALLEKLEEIENQSEN